MTVTWKGKYTDRGHEGFESCFSANPHSLADPFTMCRPGWLPACRRSVYSTIISPQLNQHWGYARRQRGQLATVVNPYRRLYGNQVFCPSVRTPAPLQKFLAPAPTRHAVLVIVVLDRERLFSVTTDECSTALAISMMCEQRHN